MPELKQRSVLYYFNVPMMWDERKKAGEAGRKEGAFEILIVLTPVSVWQELERGLYLAEGWLKSNAEYD